jgi:glucose-1-phosphate cytidylyltransferase
VSQARRAGQPAGVQESDAHLPAEPRPPVVILCGGRGTRLQEHTRAIPKPLVEIGGMPIVWHVIQLYAVQGFTRFLLATGYRGELIEEFAATCRWPVGVSVECIDTGLDTPTGGRLKLLEGELAGEGVLCVTYADGLADVDLGALIDFHHAHGALASVTVVRPRLQFGVVDVDEQDHVRGFHEKPPSAHWVNGGFFCFDARVFGYLEHDSVLERAPLERLAADGQLRAFRHRQFWECMDTYKDAIALDDMWSTGQAPWRLWTDDFAVQEPGELAALDASGGR